MSARFLRGTPIADLEMEMQQIPGFGSRRSGVIRSQYPTTHRIIKCEGCRYNVAQTEVGEKSGEGQPLSYGILLKLLADELPVSALAVRVSRLQRESEGRNPSPFKTEEHKRRFQALVRCGSYPGILIDSGFAAALYLLSSDTKLWEMAGPFVEEKTIDYRRFRLRSMDLDGYALYCVAKELYTGKSYVSLSELGDPELFHDGLLRLIIHAILISRHGIEVITKGDRESC